MDKITGCYGLVLVLNLLGIPFSAICWSILEPTRRSILLFMGEKPTAGSIIGANFTGGFVAGAVAAAATCPLDVAKTRRQIEKNADRAMTMTKRQTLAEIWRYELEVHKTISLLITGKFLT